MSSDMLLAALSYVAEGFKVFPVKPDKTPLTEHGLKDATQLQIRVREYWGKWPNAGIGLVTDGFVVLDFDAKNGGLESKVAIEEKYGTLPPTRTHRTGGGGLHYIYRSPNGTNIRNTVALGGYQGVDLRANGGYIVAPPSLHESGKRYEVVDACEIAPAPTWLTGLATRRVPAPASPTPGLIKKGVRNDRLFRLASSMRRQGASEDTIYDAVKKCYENDCEHEPPITEDELHKIAKQGAKYLPDDGTYNKKEYQPQPQGGTFALTDMGNAERLAYRHGNDLRYCYEWGCWLIWDGKRWLKDVGDGIMSRAKETVRSMYSEAALEDNKDKRGDLASHAKRCESDNKLLSMITLARDLLPIKPKELDTNTMLLNVENGTIDLQTGILYAHDRSNFITKLAPIIYDKQAVCPLWREHLNRVTRRKEELIEYLQRIFGYTLTGSTAEMVLFIIWGFTKTGKSVTVTTVQDMLGDYARETPSETLLISKYGKTHDDSARLAGSRMVVSIESEKGEKLASAKIKHLTGGDKSTGRFLYHERFEFDTTFKIFLTTNEKPLIRSEDSGIWERVKLIPFNEFIPEPERDKHIKDKLRNERPGILNWLIEGCQKWVTENSLAEPEIVRTETAQYRNEMDVLVDFLDDCCTIGAGLSVGVTKLYESYKVWCETTGDDALSKNMFSSKLNDRNFFNKRQGTSRTRIWRGLALKATTPTTADTVFNKVPMSEN